MTGIAAVTMCAAFTSCSHDLGFEQMTQEEAMQSKYEAAFIKAFGQPAPDQDWGFGTTTRGITRGADINMPTNPSFSDNLTSAFPTMTMPDFPDNLPANGVTYAGSVGQNNWSDGMAVYLDGNATWADQNKQNLIIYINGNITYTGGMNNGGNGYTFIVLKDKKLKLNSLGQNVKIYLAPGASVDLKDVYFQEFDNSKAGIYMKSGSTVEGKTMNFFQGWKVLNQGGTITAENIYLQKPGTVLWNEGTVTVSGEIYTQNEQAKIYNAQGHKITAAKLTLHNNNELLYNEGEVVISGAIATENNGGEIVNNGTLKGASLSFKAGGKMHNVGTTNITGKTHIANSQTQWKNEGQFNTGDFEVSDYAEQVFNNCKLTVHKSDNTGEFKIYGKFVVDGGGSIVTDKVYWVNNSYVFLGANAMLKVNGEFFTANKDVNGGIVGPTSGWAVVQAGSITHSGDDQFRMSYFKNLYVDAGTHFAQGSKDGKPHETTSQPYYYYDSNVKFKHLGETSPVTIPSGNCNPGYTPSTPPVTPPTGYQGRIMAEDLNAGEKSDFDFNDVVFDWKIEGNVATIQLLAAGGTLPLTVGGEEVHDKFGVKRNTMVNTGVKKADLPEPYTYTFPEGVPAEANNIPIVVTKGGVPATLTAERGKVASKINVSTTTKWVKEYKDITLGYPNFELWVANPSVDWTSNYNSAYLYND